MFKWFGIIIILFNSLNALYAINDPKTPKDPASDFTFNNSYNKAYPVNIICAGKTEISGFIYLRIKNISYNYQKKSYIFNIDEIKSIEFIEWHENIHKKNSFVFYPSKILLLLNNGQQYTLERLPEFNKIEFSEDGRKIILYTYFYDYWEKDKWRNSGFKDKSYPSKHPHPGTLSKIVFMENNDSINKFLNYITK